jgi:energy-converting hydrogenase B subunit J
MVYAGPLILGFLLGFILGSRIRDNPNSEMDFTSSVYIVFIIVAIIAAYFFGPFPWYKDSPFANGLIAAAVGIIVGKIIFGRKSIPNKSEEE